MSIIQLTGATFDETVGGAAVAVVDFWAPWCGPCRMMGPIVEELGENRTDLVVGKVNVDDEEDLAARFGVMTIPTIICFRGGKEAGRAIGYRSKEDLMQTLGL